MGNPMLPRESLEEEKLARFSNWIQWHLGSRNDKDTSSDAHLRSCDDTSTRLFNILKEDFLIRHVRLSEELGDEYDECITNIENVQSQILQNLTAESISNYYEDSTGWLENFYETVLGKDEYNDLNRRSGVADIFMEITGRSSENYPSDETLTRVEDIITDIPSDLDIEDEPPHTTDPRLSRRVLRQTSARRRIRGDPRHYPIFDENSELHDNLGSTHTRSYGTESTEPSMSVDLSNQRTQNIPRIQSSGPSFATFSNYIEF